MSGKVHEEVLWPDGAPGAQGSTVEDIPALQCYPAEPATGAAVVVCPGGGYARRAEHEGAPVAQWLNSLGISAFVLRYRVHPYKHPYPLLDGMRAIRYVRYYASKFHVDPQRIGMLGFSAGGHLVSAVSVHAESRLVVPRGDDPIERISCRPNLQVLCYPVISMGEYAHTGSRDNLLGNDPQSSLIELLSSQHHVDRGAPPAFIWHTANDQSVPVENSLIYAQALSACDVPFALHIFPQGRHGLDLAVGEPGVGKWPELCAEWLSSWGFARKI